MPCKLHLLEITLLKASTSGYAGQQLKHTQRTKSRMSITHGLVVKLVKLESTGVPALVTRWR